MTVERSEYLGKPIIILKKAGIDNYPFSFGLAKAKLALENISQIEKFVKENEKEYQKHHAIDRIASENENADEDPEDIKAAFIYCPMCGTKNRRADEKCTGCSFDLEKIKPHVEIIKIIYCPVCGAVNTQKDSECKRCRIDLAWLIEYLEKSLDAEIQEDVFEQPYEIDYHQYANARKCQHSSQNWWGLSYCNKYALLNSKYCEDHQEGGQCTHMDFRQNLCRKRTVGGSKHCRDHYLATRDLRNIEANYISEYHAVLDAVYDTSIKLRVITISNEERQRLSKELEKHDKRRIELSRILNIEEAI